MSEFLGEARVLIRPDTTQFRALLEAQIATATKKPIVVPVTADVTGTTTDAGVAAAKKAETAKQAEAAATRALEKSELALVAAQEKALLTTTQLGAARARLTGAVNAVKAAEVGLAAAERSKNAELIESAQATLAVAQAEEVRARGVARTVILANAEAAALTAATRATQAQTVALQQQAGVEAGVATARAQNLTGLALLTQGQALAAKSADDLATAQLRTLTAATESGAVQIRAAAAVRTAAISQEQLALAIQTGNVSLVRAAYLTALYTKALEGEALAALDATRAGVAHSRSLDAITTAGVASGASMLGLRGAVLTASGAFIAATVVFQAGSKAIQTATATTEELNKSTEVFGESSQQIKDFAETAATSLGISNVEALRATGIFGNLFRSINIGTPAAAEMSEILVRLASDLASFNNADPSQVLDNLRSGLVGEPEPLRKFGIFLSQARAQQEALIVTGKKSVQQLTQQEIVQARFNLILRDSALAQGDFARTSEDLANQTRILKAEVQDLGGDLGSALIPVLTDTAGLLGDVAEGAKFAADEFKNLRDSIPGSDGGGRFGFLTDTLPGSLREITAAMEVVQRQGRLTFGELPTSTLRRLNEEAARAAQKFTDLAHSFPAAGRAAQEAAEQFRELRDVLRELSGLEVEQLEIQTGLVPGGREAEKSNLREQIEADKEAVEAAASESAARRRALEELNRDQKALEALEKQDAQDAESSANATKSAADKALAARREADAALLELFGIRRDDAGRRIAAAAETEGVADDIRRQDQLQALIKQQIQKVRDRISDEKTRKAAIRELRIALIASRAEEDALRAQQKADAAARREEGINLDIAFAETTENVGREISARQRLIALLKKQQKEVKRGTNEWRRLRNEIAEQQEAIADARKQANESDKDGKSAQQFFFEQLQAQQGFASNLLGNLIPRDQTAGLVGVPAPTTGPGRGISVAASVQEGKQGGGPTAGQASTTNDILIRILEQLKALNGANAAPEASRQRQRGAANLDTQGVM